MLINKSRIPFKSIVFVGILPSFLKIIIYKFKGYKIGKNVSIGFGSVVIGDKVRIGDNTSIGFAAIIRGKVIDIGRYVKIGSTTFIDTVNISIDDDARINEQVFIGGLENPESSLKLGKRTLIMQMSFLNTTKPLEIGDDTGIGGHSLLFTHGSWSSAIDGYPVNFAPIKIGKNVWLPWRVFIMPGITIGDNSIIGANSLVNINIPKNSVAAGSPAKIIIKNYNFPISEKKRKEIIDNIFRDYKGYLEFHKFIINVNEDNSGFIWKIRKGKENYNIIYKTNNSLMENKDISTDSILISDYSEDIKNLKLIYKMVIDLRDKKRTGTSDIGEETVKYFTRYGIKLDRLD